MVFSATAGSTNGFGEEADLAPLDARDHRDLARKTANDDTPGRQPARRFKAPVFTDDLFQAFDHDMARCSLLVSQPVSFMLGLPEKARGLSKRRTIPFDSVIGNRTAVR